MEEDWINPYVGLYLDRLITNGSRKVKLGASSLCELPPKLFQVSEALSLDLNLNHLTEASFSFESFSSNSFQGWKKLESVNLSGNEISKPPTGLTPTFFPSLKSLNLSNNPLDLSDDLFDPSQLSEGNASLLGQLEGLKIQKLGLRSAPKKFLSLCPKLNHIAIRFNCLSSDDLCALIQSYPLLQNLRVSFNPIYSLDPSIGTLTNLKKLDVSGTSIRTLPDEIGNLIHLTKLKAENNFLEHLPDSMINLQFIETLHLQGNLFEKLPPVIIDYETGVVRFPRLKSVMIQCSPSFLSHDLARKLGLSDYSVVNVPKVQCDDPDPPSSELPSLSSQASKNKNKCEFLIDLRDLTGPDLILEESGSKKPLYLGNYEDAQNLGVLDTIGVKSILTVGDYLPSLYPYRFTYKVISIPDEPRHNLKQHFHDCIDFIDRERESGSVLVHCAAGVSRSASTVIAYLMKTQGLSYSEARSHVQQRRDIISPNSGFIRQLIQFEEELKNSGSSLQLS